MLLLAVDPGNIESALVVWNGSKILHSSIKTNDKALEFISLNKAKLELILIEMIASYGNVVGKEIFDTCRMIGKIEERASNLNIPTELVYRKTYVSWHCESSRGNDADIRAMMIKKYGEPGTKKTPGFTYGVTADMWQALAIATWYTEIHQFQNLVKVAVKK